MAENQRGYMAELDDWTEENVITPVWELARLSARDQAPENGDQILAEVRKALREKVLQSYRNGQKAGPRKGFAGKPTAK